ncbi:FecR domain-containing protein [Pedobacter sp. PAMC26386]|nr:FecR domain-containing protein [Pedobacter sp. PAMC26386]
MENQKAKDLIQKYIDGTATQKERDILNAWYIQRSNSTIDEMPEPNYAYWNKKIGDQLPRAAKTTPIWSRYSAAAAIILIAWASLLFLKQYHQKTNQIISAVTADITPGKNSATLTLANGKKIILSDVTSGALAEEAGVSISKTKEGQLVYEIEDSNSQTNQMNTLTTANGETYQVRLPDGSLVWLNAASSLTYPTSLNKGDVRRVELKGEGYFEIAKDKKHPFVVKTAEQEVKVLGTHFNINAYHDERKTVTTLLEGSVKVSSSKEQKTLFPNQQSSITEDGFFIKTVETDDVIAWKNGLFLFNDEPLGSIMRKLSRWYDVEVIYHDVDQDKLFFGGVSRYDNVSKVLKKLELTGGVHFKIDGRRVIVNK